VELLIVQFSPFSLTTHTHIYALSLSLSLSLISAYSHCRVSCSPRYVNGFVAISMVSDEMDMACSTNGISKKCIKKCCSESPKRVGHLEG
jgi:hypothetical protein